MPFLERNLLIKYNEDGLDDWVVVREPYLQDVALFLVFDPQQGFLFEKRIKPDDPLFGKIVIKAGKAKDPGECKFPQWIARRECLEEVGAFAEIIVPLDPLFDEKQRNMLYPFLMTGTMWGGIENREPDKGELIWFPLEQVYSQNRGKTVVNPVFQLETTRRILLNTRSKMEKLGL